MKDFIEKGSREIKQEDLEKVIKQEHEIKQKIARVDKKIYEELREDVFLLFSLLRDYWSGNYKVVPWRTIALAAFAFLYLLNPLDLLPDLLLPTGLFDDVAVFLFVLASVRGDLEKYKTWKASIDGQKDTLT